VKIWQILCSAISAVSGFNLCIDFQCPQCGAPAQLEETGRVFACGFCRVKSCLIAKDFFRCVIPHSAPDGTELIHVPYWRLKGTLFSCAAGGIHKRFMDISHPAVSLPGFPGTLGLRTQTMKLEFRKPDMPGYFLRHTVSPEKIMQIFTARFNAGLSSPALCQDFVGENLSLIYAPFYAQDGQLWDAVLHHPVSADLPQGFAPAALGEKAAKWRMRFVPSLCPACGWDLHTEPDAMVLFCRNCETAWQSGQDRLVPVTFGLFPDKDPKNRVWFPFWRIQADVSGISLQSYADLIRAANLIKVAREEDKQSGFYFWTPAFKVQPRFFLNLCRQMTLSQPREKPVRKLPPGRIISANFPVTQAVKSLKINLAGFLKPPSLVQSRIRDIEIRPRKYLLVLIPFQEDHLDYFQPEFQIAVNKNMLGLSGNL